MLTIRFKTLEGKLSAYLPRGVGGNPDRVEPREEIRITVDVREPGTRVHAAGIRRGQPWNGEGRFAFADRTLEYRVGPFRTGSPAQLRERLEELFAEDVRHHPDPADRREVSLEPGEGTVYADVVAVLDAVIEAGFTGLTFVGVHGD